MKGKIFNAQEVQAMLNGSKVMFREVIKPQPNSNINPVKLDYLQRTWQWATKESRRECPYQVGQKIFCKEIFCKSIFGKAIYKDEEKEIRGFGRKEVVIKWKPAQQMKQEQSRITLLIKEIRVEKLADISEEDCWKEGLEELADYQDQVKVCQMAKQLGECIEDPRPHFATYWNTTHKKPEEKFEASPFVWVVSFEVINN